MNLIDVDGLAVFGPGSEWLWTMVQFIAITRRARDAAEGIIPTRPIAPTSETSATAGAT